MESRKTKGGSSVSWTPMDRVAILCPIRYLEGYMFSMGFGEILVIGVVALLVIGPKQLPQVARVVGRLFGEFKKATEDLSGGLMNATREAKDALHKATNIDELTRVPEEPPPPPNPAKAMDFEDEEHHHAHDPDHEHKSFHDDHEENLHPPLDDHDTDDK